jgi:hypothetical protein
MKRDRITKRRDKLARMAERAAVPERPIRGRGPLYLIRPAVSAACAPSLQAIAAALRDGTLDIDEESLDAAWSFFTDGGTALYGYDVTEALREIVRLQQRIVTQGPVEFDQNPVAVAARKRVIQLTHPRTIALVKKMLALGCGVGALAFAAVAAAGYFNGPLPPNHHIHDCTLPASQCAYPHLGVGFFPRILNGGDLNAYLQDPAECNDATDKALLPPNVTSGTPQDEQPLRAGVCYTSTELIHLRSIDVADPAPAGWLGPIAPVTLANGVTYVTYWLLTPR